MRTVYFPVNSDDESLENLSPIT